MQDQVSASRIVMTDENIVQLPMIKYAYVAPCLDLAVGPIPSDFGRMGDHHDQAVVWIKDSTSSLHFKPSVKSG